MILRRRNALIYEFIHERKNRNEKNNIFSLLSDADVVKYVRGADPAALTELMFD